MNPFRTGKLVLFQVTYDRDWHFFEIIFFVIIGIFGVRILTLIPFVTHHILNIYIGSIRSAGNQIQPTSRGVP